MTSPDDSLSRAPFFIVGCPRSGTTLLRRTDDLEAILAYSTFPRMNLEPEEVRRRVREAAPRDYAALVRLVMGMYAEQQGKPRWGDKTPRYVDHVALLARWLPDALFVHVIRDGRDVAASLRESSGSPIASAALFWRRRVELGRRAGSRLGPSRYLETRLEDLVAAPEAELTRICRHLGEEFHPSMLTGGRELDAAALSYRERHLRSPPTPGLRDWRAGLTAVEQRQAEEVCRPLLLRLGYPVGGRPSRAVAVGAHATRAVDVVSRAPAFVRRRGKELEEVAGGPRPPG